MQALMCYTFTCHYEGRETIVTVNTSRYRNESDETSELSSYCTCLGNAVTV